MVIEFGKVFINSKISKTFHIKNGLRNSISARMVVDKDELNNTY